MKILSFGEIIWDVFPNYRCIGGAPFNFAAHAAKLGAESYLISAVGNDALGKEAMDSVKKFGIKEDFITTVPDMITGQCTVTLNEKGIPSYDLKDNTAYDRLSPPENIKNETFDAIAFGTLALRHEHNLEKLKELILHVKAKNIYSDLNVRKPHTNGKSVHFAMTNANIVKISDEELPDVTEFLYGKRITEVSEGIRILCESFPQIEILIITLGEKGSVACHRASRRVYKCEAPKVEAVSTVGAGDSFGAAFLTEYLKGEAIENCLKKASEVSGYVVAHSEAIPL